MTLSLKDIAQDCLALSPPFSVVRDVFGYSAPRRTMSIKRQLELIKGPCLKGINLILVGSQNFTAADFNEIEYAIQFMRDIYSQVNLGIRKISKWYSVPGPASLSWSEAFDLADEYKVDNDFLDLFIVRTMTDADGVSSIDGPCDKDTKDGECVVSLNGNPNNSGNTFAHEIGHFLGLGHSGDPNNFITSASNANTAITNNQGNTMKKHCFVDKGCY